MSTPRNTPRTHPLNASYLVVGLVFLGLAASWALREAGVIDLAEARWVFPLTLVVAGLVGIVAMVAKGLSRGDDSRDTSDSGYPTTSYSDYPDYDEGDLR